LFNIINIYLKTLKMGCGSSRAANVEAASDNFVAISA
jgi:hypothetical protein